MVTIDTSIRMIMIQFSFSNPDAIPAFIRGLERQRETREECVSRKVGVNGSPCISPTEGCTVREFVENLEAAGYQLVDAFYQRRVDHKDPRGNRWYHMARFVFASAEWADPSEEFIAMRTNVKASLQEMCEASLWRVRGFLNPFYQEGQEIAGQHAVSINCESRQPLKQSDGKPVVSWQKDAAGNRVGNAPLPLQPKHSLKVIEKEIVFA